MHLRSWRKASLKSTICLSVELPKERF